MIKKTMTVLLIAGSPEYAGLIRRWLSPREDIEFAVYEADSLRAGLNRLEKGNGDAILLGPGLPDGRGLETFRTIKMHAAGIPILILSGSHAESLTQQIQRNAGDYYIVKNACDGKRPVKALRDGARRSIHRVPEDTAADQDGVIGVMGAKGGVGATTFACNLAIELRRQTDQRVLVADLDVNAGLIGFLMRTESKSFVLDAVAHIHRLDHSFWNGIVAHGPGGVDIMPSPNLLGVDSADTGKIQSVFATIRMFYRWTVLDLGRLASFSPGLLDKVSELYLVTTVTVPALHEAKRTIGAIARAGFDPQRLRLIVNQAGTDEYTGNEPGQLFGVPVYARLPGSAREPEDACSHGHIRGANSDYRVRVADVARRIAGLPNGTPGGQVGQLGQLRSFADRFRTNGQDAAAAARA